MQRMWWTALMCLATPALAAGWQCHNRELEIRCTPVQCESGKDFTPWDVQIQSSGRLSICAYTACWEGRGRVLQSGSHLLISAQKLPRAGPNASPADFMVALNTRDHVGLIQGEGFAMPMTCERNP